MDFCIKNKTIYHKDYILFNYASLSVYLIPLFLLILIHKKFIKYFSYLFLSFAIIGTFEVYYEYILYPHIILFFIINGIFHLIFLFPLTNIKKYMVPNTINYLIGVLGILFINFIPVWQYKISRHTSEMIIILIYVLSTILYKLYNYLF